MPEKTPVELYSMPLRSPIVLDMIDGQEPRLGLATTRATLAVYLYKPKPDREMSLVPALIDCLSIGGPILTPTGSRKRRVKKTRTAPISEPVGLCPIPMKLDGRFFDMALTAFLHGCSLYRISWCKQWALDPTNPKNAQPLPVPA